MSELPLADLEAFAAVAESRSFRQAALLRGVSASSLSEAVRRLESHLSARLLNRTTRSVTLTEAGERLVERIRPLLAEISSALGEVVRSDGQLSGRLRLNVPTFVARQILPTLLSSFLDQYPGVNIEVVA